MKIFSRAVDKRRSKYIAIGTRVLLIAIGILVMPRGFASEENNGVNYGDPTAVFKNFGVSHNGDGAIQTNLVYGQGKNVFQLDLTAQYRDRAGTENLGTKGMGYRARYFRVNDGLGFSMDVIGSHNQNADSTTAVGGVIYKINLTDRFSVFPMLSVGGMTSKAKADNQSYTSGIIQPALYALYAFDEGHWLYANPRYTHYTDTPSNVNDYYKYDQDMLDIELGGGYMLNEWSAAEFKIEHKVRNDTQKQHGHYLNRDDTISWLKYSIFW
ncbi:hypothetical protein [Vibrio barjaei]|uniref:hypothetical protein n=1 Tax=Vibrio barjaei TaxID=1676683 RepID=UPI002283B167|nr:hypothetical protein [Vibrio barjaei]MCY9871152.1 hypothetical protein [Vibrio barjaei]